MELQRTIVEVVLSTGHRLRGQVLSQAGEAIPGAVVRTDSDNHGERPYQWLTFTDQDGRFQWNSAPAGSVLYWFEAEGYKPAREVSLIADGVHHEIRLRPLAVE